jgi:hypothetical protein
VDHFAGTVQRLECSTRLESFIHGIPGSGKSVLAAFIGRLFHLSDPKVPTIIFFCDSKDERKATADSVFRNAIVQLIHYRPNLVLQLGLERQRTGHNKVASWTHLKSIFLRFIREFPRVQIVIDALDELNALGQDVVSETIANLRSSTSEPSIIKTCITSRTRADVLSKVAFCDHSITIKRDIFDHDLRIFVSVSIDRSQEIQAVFSSNQTFIRELKETLLARSEGMFLMPKLLLQELRSKETIDQMRTVLHDIPDSLSDYYTQLIRRIEPSRKDFAHTVLKWLAYTVRPLSLEELGIALELQARLRAPDGRYRIPNLKWSIEKACSCLVVVQMNKVQLTHSSVKRFLLKPPRQSNDEDDKVLSMDTSIVHEEIALVCLQYLSLPAFSRPLSCRTRFLNQDIGFLKEDFPLLSYSCQFWPTHVGLSRKVSQRLLDKLAQFLSSVNCRSWIEMVFSFWTFPNVKMEYASNNLLDWVPKAATGDEEALIFAWTRDLWDLLLGLSGLLQTIPSEIHFLIDVLPNTAVHDPTKGQMLLPQFPPNFCSISGVDETLVQSLPDASGQKVPPKSDRFLITESAMIDWESTISTPLRYLSNTPIRWEVSVQNLLTQKRYGRHSLALACREGICCSVAIAPNDQQIAVAWPEYQDENSTEPLKIRTYAWTLRWDESRSPVWRKWDWTDDRYGVDYTRAAGFYRTKNCIAFTSDSKILATPGGYYYVANGNLGFAPPIFQDREVSGLTFSVNAEYVWGSRGDHEIAICHRDSEEVIFVSDSQFELCEVLAVSPDGTSAIIFLHQKEREDGGVLKLSVVTIRKIGYSLVDLFLFKRTPQIHLLEQREYIRTFYASAGQIDFCQDGRAVVGIASQEKDEFEALMFTVDAHQTPSISQQYRVTLLPPKGSFLLSLRFQKATSQMYGLTTGGTVWRFARSDDSSSAANSIWVPQSRQDEAHTRNYFISDFLSDSQTLVIGLRLGLVLVSLWICLFFEKVL